MNEPLNDAEVVKLLREVIEHGTIAFSQHARDQMEARSLDEVDVINVLRGGYCGGADLEHGSWRYQIHTQKIYVVIAFRSETNAVVVTAWRKK